jgi:hypothetical protein
MKTLFVALVTLLFAFFFGCQSSITDPEVLEPTKFVGTSEDNSIDKDWLTFQYPNVIRLDGVLFDPSHRLNSLVKISGIVRYRLEEMNPAERPPRSAVKVQLYVDAKMKSNCPNQNHLWTVHKTSEDVIYASPVNQAVYFLEKSFRVKNTCCSPLNLILKFQVSEKSLTLESIRLVKARIYEVAEDSTF